MRRPHDPLLRDLVEEFTLSLSGAGRSPETAKAYQYAVCDLETFLTASGASVDPEQISPLQIERWLADRRASKSAANAGFVHRHVRPFFRWLIRRGYLDVAKDPFRSVATPKVETKVVQIMSDDDVRAVLAATEGSDWSSRRDRALVRVLMDTGIRRGEACGLTVEDLDLATGTLHVRLTKGRRERLVPLGVKARMELRAWLRARAEYLRRNGHADGGALFCGRYGGVWSGSGMWQAVQRRAEQAGIRPARLVHVWRHGWATRALEAGAGELDVQVLGGWRSLAMVAKYTASNRQERALREHAGAPGTRSRGGSEDSERPGTERE